MSGAGEGEGGPKWRFLGQKNNPELQPIIEMGIQVKDENPAAEQVDSVIQQVQVKIWERNQLQSWGWSLRCRTNDKAGGT